ncbi:MAG TPA: outer membrane lipid asymmetry maintenance protein MlaD [Burkholderiales bacterium]|nr:outer membrane lipid asymmetry maintenance protein MlaD [Burkholderiales bacterium]
MERKTVDLWVGLFVAAGLLAILLLALKVGNLGSFSFSNNNYVVYADFDNIGGLKVRAPVKSAGVVVGRIASIGFDDQRFQARVTLDIDRRFQFPKDTAAKILTAGLLGEQYVGLEAGGDTKMLKQGDTIRLTQSAVVLENLIGQFLYSKAAGGGSKGSSAAPSGSLH